MIKSQQRSTKYQFPKNKKKTCEKKINEICHKTKEELELDQSKVLAPTSINHKLFLLQTFKNWNLFCVTEISETIEKLQERFEDALKRTSLIFAEEKEITKKEITKELVTEQWKAFQYLKDAQKCSELQGLVLPQLETAKHSLCGRISHLKQEFDQQFNQFDSCN